MSGLSVMLVINRGVMGGAQNHVLTLARGLVARGHRPLIVTGAEGGYLAASAGAAGLPVRVVPRLCARPGPLLDLRALVDLRRLIDRHRPDLVHAHSTKAGFLGRHAAAMAGLPAVFTAHGWAFDRGAPPLLRAAARLAERLSVPATDALILLTRHDARLARSAGHGPSRCHLVPNGLPDGPALSGDLPYVLPTPGRQGADAPMILSAARFAGQKDQAGLLLALAALPDLDLHLRLAGDGPRLAETRALAHGLGLDGRAAFLGELQAPDLAAEYARADIFAHLSHFEGQPLAIIEAMRAGLPVVASDVSGVAELVRHEVTGLLVPRGQPAAAAAALRRLATDPALRARLGAAGRQHFLAHYSEGPMVEATISVYQQALEKHGARSGGQVSPPVHRLAP